MDIIDKQILTILQTNGRLSTADIAERVHLSPSPCARRIKRLEQEGYISSYHAKLDRLKINLGMTAFVQVNLTCHQESDLEKFEHTLSTIDNIINGHVVSGQYDYLLEVACKDLIDYERFMRRLRVLPMVKDITTNFTIRSFKIQTPLPVSNVD
jgi:Lrp/AsnC family leucine-responsive transcriptional regulator